MDWVVEQTGASMESLCRRPTGGGVVDHREDWTYALVIPAEHPAAGSQIRASYEALHLALGKAMNLLGAPTKGIPPPLNKGEAGDFPSTPGHCFEEPVAYDLVCLEDGAKVAGAAMKRSREGLLLQGSIQKKRLGDLPWDRLSAVLAQQIADLLKTKPEQIEWPDDWNTSREPFLSEIESIAWQRR